MIVKCRKTESNPDKSRVPCQGLSCYVETLLALGTLHRPVTRPVVTRSGHSTWRHAWIINTPEKLVLNISSSVKSKTVSKEVCLNQICHRSWSHRGSRSPPRKLHQSLIVPAPELTLLGLSMHNCHRYPPWQKISFSDTPLFYIVSKINSISFNWSKLLRNFSLVLNTFLLLHAFKHESIINCSYQRSFSNATQDCPESQRF